MKSALSPCSGNSSGRRSTCRTSPQSKCPPTLVHTHTLRFCVCVCFGVTSGVLQHCVIMITFGRAGVSCGVKALVRERVVCAHRMVMVVCALTHGVPTQHGAWSNGPTMHGGLCGFNLQSPSSCAQSGANVYTQTHRHTHAHTATAHSRMV